jgi:adenine C2-methylase RlmN of 23S rRNA A2503 and tRNA A37
MIKPLIKGTIMVIVKALNIDGYDLPVMIINLKNQSIVSLPTQIGCAIGCTFCISSHNPFIRNLKIHEMTQLIVFGLSHATNKQSLISFTGEGEPFLNLKEINKAILSNEINPEISSFRLCTSGIKPNLFSTVASSIKPIHLQVSLHSPFDTERKKLIPHTKPVCEIFNALRLSKDKFSEIAINYVLVQGFNDSESDLSALSDLVDKDWVIKLNPLLDDSEFVQSKHHEMFYIELTLLGHAVKIFTKVGSTIKNKFYSKLKHEKHNAFVIS